MRDSKARIPSTNYTARAITTDPSVPPKQRLRTYSWYGEVYKNIAIRAIAWLFFVATLTLIYFALTTKEVEYAKFAVFTCVSFIVLKLIGYTDAQKIRCTLCHGSLLHSKRCSKHREAKAFPLIGHAKTAILNTLFRGKCQCMYCGSWFKMRR